MPSPSPEPPRPTGKRGRNPTPLADQVFACAFKVYSTFSGRRFNCDLQDAIDKGYMSCTMHPNKLCKYMESEELTPAPAPAHHAKQPAASRRRNGLRPDSTGFSTSRFVRWYDEKYGVQRSGKDWVKAHAIMTGVKTNIITAVVIAGRDAGDSPQFKPLVETTAENFTVKEVPADKGYLSTKTWTC